MHRAADIVADYVEGSEKYAVLPRVRPGEVRGQLPAAPPEEGEPLETLLDDYSALIEPNVTHWNHPGFLAYFATSGSGPGILGETLAAGLNAQAMLWRTGPAPTELEELTCDWVRQMVGLPEGFTGHINDTASMSTLLSLAAARHRSVGGVLERGLAGREDVPALTVYASEQAHSSVDKACIALGLGLAGLRKVPVDDGFSMRADALEAAIADDRRSGRWPLAVVATLGTTSTTSSDPVRACLDVVRREGVWLHVDAAYAGPAAICEEFRPLFDGWEGADSVVLNPHKWLFTPMDCSVLLLRDPAALRAAFALTPDYLRTTEGATNLSDYGPQLGRRFRALKLWFVIRAFGVEGLRARIREHCVLARKFAGWVADAPDFELRAGVPFSVVCFRATRGETPEEQDRFNERLLERVNAAGPVMLSATRLRGRVVLRLAIGNIRTREEHVARAWELLRQAAG